MICLQISVKRSTNHEKVHKQTPNKFAVYTRQNKSLRVSYFLLNDTNLTGAFYRVLFGWKLQFQPRNINKTRR